MAATLRPNGARLVIGWLSGSCSIATDRPDDPLAIASPRGDLARKTRLRGRRREPLDLVVQRQEPLAGERETVLGPQLAVADIDVDLLLEGQELQHGQRVALAVDRAEVVAGERKVGARREQEVVVSGVAREERRREVGVRDREPDAHVAAAVVAERRVDADVDRLARVRERPDPP